MSTTVRRATDKFVIDVDGESAGLAAFADRDGQRVFFHTEIDDAFSGQGLSSVLVAAALDATRDEGLRIVPVCPLVAHWLTKHHELDALVDEPTAEIVEWLGSRSS